jgi:endonuclease/exonuclease/phosphatase family metal-dependent hydrolase
MDHGEVSVEIAQGLLALQERIKAAGIPSSKLDETINIASWNIREFGKIPRSEPAIHYIAEILGQFDLVGIVELRDDVSDLARVLKILGPYWDAVYSDTITDSGGNGERTAYLYDSRAVTFNGLAAEADAPRKKVGDEYLPTLSFWRAPYLASFKAGNFDFLILTTHARWGNSDAARTQELGMLAQWIDEKSKNPSVEDKDILVMGDFNIPAIDSPMFKAVTAYGLKIPDALLGVQGSNLEKDKRYDQILIYPRYTEKFTNAGGALDFYIDEAHIAELFPGGMKKLAFTFQMSDHLPLWMQVNTDLASEKLEQIIQEQREP